MSVPLSTNRAAAHGAASSLSHPHMSTTATQQGKTVGIFGGSFNPIHLGHIALARHLLEVASLDEVWFVVSPQNPLKHQAQLMDDQLRWKMVCEALKEEPHLKPCDVEMRLPTPSYMWLTLQHLEKICPQHRLVLLIGGDNWQHFHRWYRHEDIIERYPIVIYPRGDSSEKIRTAALPSTVRVMEAPLLDISSTMIRQRMAAGESIAHLVPAPVASILQAP